MLTYATAFGKGDQEQERAPLRLLLAISFPNILYFLSVIISVQKFCTISDM